MAASPRGYARVAGVASAAAAIDRGGFRLGYHVALPFLYDFDVQARLLVALPFLVLAELIVHERMRQVVRQFVERDLLPDTAQANLDSAIASAMRLRDSLTVEAVLLALVYIIGVGFIWRTQAAVDLTTWYGVPEDGQLAPSLAGWWFGCVSLPMMQFLLLRWYFRLFIWARFLWQMSRIELKLLPMHPDRCGGLGFLSDREQCVCTGVICSGGHARGCDGQLDFLHGRQAT